MHITPPHLAKRQQPVAPSAAGIGGQSAVAPANAPTGSLLLGSDSAAPTSVFQPLVSDGVTVTTKPVAPTTSSASPTSTPDTDSSRDSGSSISTGAVVGISVGVFAFLACLILFVRWTLKRMAPKRGVARSRNAPSPSSPSRSAPGSKGSKPEPWTKLGDDDDRWEGMEKPASAHAQPEEKDITEKTSENDGLRLFNKTPSLRSVSDEKALTSEGGHNFDMSTMPNFAKYHPELAEEYAKAPERPFATRADGSPVVSWDGETAHDSFLSLSSARVSATDAMSPTAVMARQTPQATASVLHHWESAEVLTMDDTKAEDSPEPNPFADEVENRKSVANPFFNAQSVMPVSRSNNNPFSDNHSVRTRRSSIKTARRSDVSEASTIRGNGAMQSLIAALDTPDIPDNKKRDTIRSSIQASIESGYLTAEGESVSNFPMPPTPKAV
ncbi:hypothetical protein EVG20_g3522 [Dentipellis fragilis]|uniref:Uncharacterized protein n=1 Tax=Dentipellis fragilis TaxID=205917 RepID=A0A4Y9Z157_9AGAM|nr:hypothetical protein EVG20_g3522 [Dentipellis fragilis]